MLGLLAAIWVRRAPMIAWGGVRTVVAPAHMLGTGCLRGAVKRPALVGTGDRRTVYMDAGGRATTVVMVGIGAQR